MAHYLDNFIATSRLIGLGAAIYGFYGLFTGDQAAFNQGVYTMIGSYPLTLVARSIRRRDLQKAGGLEGKIKNDS